MKEKLAELYYETHKIDASYTSKIIDAFIAGWEAKEASIGGDEVEFHSLVDELADWSNKTFGSHRKAISLIYHLQKEVAELIEAIEQDPENFRAVETELADCFLLIIDASKKQGLTSHGIISNARSKFEKVKQRVWGTPDENGVVEHVRTNSLNSPLTKEKDAK